MTIVWYHKDSSARFTIKCPVIRFDNLDYSYANAYTMFSFDPAESKFLDILSFFEWIFECLYTQSACFFSYVKRSYWNVFLTS